MSHTNASTFPQNKMVVTADAIILGFHHNMMPLYYDIIISYPCLSKYNFFSAVAPNTSLQEALLHLWWLQLGLVASILLSIPLNLKNSDLHVETVVFSFWHNPNISLGMWNTISNSLSVLMISILGPCTMCQSPAFPNPWRCWLPRHQGCSTLEIGRFWDIFAIVENVSISFSVGSTTERGQIVRRRLRKPGKF